MQKKYSDEVATCRASIGRSSKKNEMKLTSDECWAEDDYTLLHELTHILGMKYVWIHNMS